MRTTILFSAVLLSVALSRPDTARACSGSDAVQGGSLCLAMRSFGKRDSADTLVVFLHGDVSRGGPADYMHGYAEQTAGMDAGIFAVSLVRPGYPGGGSLKSEGDTNDRRDHYTAANNAAIAGAIEALKGASGAKRVIVVAHSGGAAMAGAVLGQNPGLIEAAVLASCPCNVGRWRKDRGRSPWPNSQSPQDFVDGVARGTRVVAITGSRDNNTPRRLAEAYVAALAGRGIDARFAIADGAAHDFDRLWPTVEPELRRLLAGN